MGNFEKLGILVIIVLVVTILVLTFWGMNIPLPEPAEGAVPPKSLSGVADSSGSDSAARAHEATPDVWPDEGGREDEEGGGVVIRPAPDGGNGGEARIDPPEPEPQPRVVTHVVKKGDTLWSIAVQYYGSGARSRDIQRANPGVTAANLVPDMKLRIPDAEADVRGGGGGSDAGDHGEARTGRRQCTVQKGDNLWKIAARELGNGERFREIYDLNRDRIGSDPANVQVGMVLLLP